MRLVLSKDFNFGTKDVMLGYLRHITRIKFTKKNCHISNQHPQNAKPHAKRKIFWD